MKMPRLSCCAALPGRALLSRCVGRTLAAALVCSAAFGTAPAWAQWGAAPQTPLRSLFAPLKDSAVPASYPLAAQVNRVIEALSNDRLGEASQTINAALKLDTANASLHFLNGLVYHLMARQGDVSKLDTAIEGYRAAVRFDESHWVAHEFLGLAHLEKRMYREALASFAEVLLLRPDDPDALHRAMVAAYLANDPAMACSMADRLRLQPEAQQPRGFLRSSVLVYAACGEDAAAQAQREGYFRKPNAPEERRRVDQRLADWQHVRGQRLGAAQLDAQGRPLGVERLATQSGGGSSGGSSQGSSAAATGKPVPVPDKAPSSGSQRMVLVDVVMIRTEDTISTTRGINLLSALSLQFGANGSAAYSRESTLDPNQNNGAVTTIIKRAISVPALTYSLNIANANNNLNEVLARPTITALEGVRSEFFSGSSLSAAVVSSGSTAGSGAVSIEKRYGVKLALLPQILDNGMVRLAIDASRTFLKPPSSDIAFTYKVEISEIQVNANVVMRLGDTLVLSGLSERESTSLRDGVPGLQDVPGVQYLFARQSHTEYQKSVLILLTPRQASYTWLTEDSKAAIAARPDPFHPSVDALRSRFNDWFKPYPNLASVFHHFNSAELYREFRTGDVTIDAWERMDTTAQRLKHALGFLHY